MMRSDLPGFKWKTSDFQNRADSGYSDVLLAEAMSKIQSSFDRIQELSGAHAESYISRIGNRQLIEPEPSRAIEVSWLFLALSEGVDANPTVADLAKYVRGVNSIVAQHKYSLMDMALASLSTGVGQISTGTLVVLARSISPIGSHLQFWRSFLKSAKMALDQRGLESGKLLKGLI